MRINQIKKLIKIVEESNIRELEQQDKFLGIIPIGSVKIKKGLRGNGQPQIHQKAKEENLEILIEQKPNKVEILSNTKGKIYLENPDTREPYVSVGNHIQKDQMLARILVKMNEDGSPDYNKLKSEYSGILEEVLVEDYTIIEFNQPLFLIKTYKKIEPKK